MTDIAKPVGQRTAIDVPVMNAPALVTLSALGLGILAINMLLLDAVAAQVPQLYAYNLFVLPLMATGVLTIIATRVAVRVPPGIGLLVILSIGLVLRLAAIAHEPLLSDDIYRYIWDGRVQGAGINPYLYLPTDSPLADLRDDTIFPNINRADYAHTIYPPAAQFFFAAVTRLGESTLVMRLAMIGCEAVTLLLLIDLLRRFDKPVTLAVAYAWHPLAVWEVGNNGHVDALMVALVMLGVWLLARERRLAGGLMIVLAALVKPYALVALPAFWRPRDWKLPLAAAALVALCYVPFLGAGTGVFGFLSGYVAEEGLQNGREFWLVLAARSIFGNVPGLVGLYLAIAAATLGLLGAKAALRTQDTSQQATNNIAALLMAALFFLSPNYAWYYLVLVPFIPLGAGAPAWVLSLGGLVLYLFYPSYEAHFLLWKSALGIAFLLAMLGSRMERSPLAVRTPRGLRWMR